MICKATGLDSAKVPMAQKKNGGKNILEYRRLKTETC